MLAELLAASALLASTLTFKGTLIVQLQGAGPVSLLVVECTADLGLRATAQWHEDAASLPDDAPLRALAGDPAASRLAIMLDPKDGGPIYQGIVALEAASIAALVEHYLTASEQIESRLVLAAGATRVRGMLLQRMPGAGPGDDATWRQASHLDLRRRGPCSEPATSKRCSPRAFRATTSVCWRRAPRVFAATAPASAWRTRFECSVAPKSTASSPSREASA